MYAPRSYCTENSSTCSNDCLVNELSARFAVRFLMKKSKRFDLQKPQMQHRLQQCTVKNEPTPECLAYLGLTPSEMRSSDQDELKEENRILDFDFRKPQVYECCYCKKIFFHKILYRRHMMRHMKRIHRCSKCRRVFSLKALKKRHEIICRYRIIQSLE